MKDLTRIEPEPETWDMIAEEQLEWLSRDPNKILEDYGLSFVVRLLIHKVNELTDELNRIKASNK